MAKKRSSASEDEAQSQKRSRSRLYPGPEVPDLSLSIAKPIQKGIIKSVKLQNFICHQNLNFDFTDNVNFITGMNGSGKSAVMTGIMLALGGKSSTTGRFSSIKGFIKNGAHTAIISVTLKNEGTHPFKVEKYGRQITVERIISLAADRCTSSYKLKSEEGRVISSTKDELNNLLDNMNIQTDNPVVLLTQDVSRVFLESQKPKDKYKFFYKGTQLQAVYEKYMEADCKRKEAEQDLEKKKETLPELEADLKKLAHLVEHAEKITEYENELFWAQVIEVEKIRDLKKQDVEEAEGAASKLMEVSQKYEEKIAVLTQKLGEYKKNIDEFSQARDSIKQEVVKMREDRLSAQDKLKQIRNDYNQLKTELSKCMMEVRNYENDIKKQQEKDEEQIIAEKHKIEQMRIRLEQQHAEIEEQLHEINSKLNDHGAATESIRRHIESAKTESVSVKREKGKCQEHIRDLHSSKTNRATIFGPAMKDIIEEINRETSRGYFTQKPRGPIGACINVKEKKWASAIEVCLTRNFLKGFCCDNVRDMQKLQRMLTKYVSQRFPKPGVACSKFLPHVHDVQEYRAQSQYPTVLDMIIAEDPVIANYIIDSKNIERILLIDDYNTAVQLMQENPPRNCICAYLPNGDQIYPMPNYRFYSCDGNFRNYLQEATQDDIANWQMRLQGLQQQEEEISAKIYQFESEILEKKRLIGELTNKRSNLIKTNVLIRNKFDTLPVIPELTNISYLQEVLDQFIKRKEGIEKDLTKLEAEKAAVEAEYEKIQGEYSAKNSIFEQQSKNYIQLNTELGERQHKKERLEVQKAQNDKNYREAVKKFKALQGLLDEAEAAVQEMIRNSEGLPCRVDTRRSIQTIKAVLAETKRFLEEEGRCNREELKEAYLKKKSNYKNAKQNIAKLEYYTKFLEEMVHSRLETFKRVRDSTSLYVGYYFKLHLQYNGYIGSIDYNHDKETITIAASPKSDTAQKTKELSGGERSYVTLCFLLALWEVMEIPFRILDEYDVFMDAANRSFAINLLISNATKKDRQFIFLSPLELPSSARNPNVKVHNLLPPKRSSEEVSQGVKMLKKFMR